MPNLTPPINATGTFVLIAPYSVDPTKTYRCEAIRGVAELEDSGEDVYLRYYQQHGLSKSVQIADAKNDVNIVTLMSSDGPVIHVPSSYIHSYPQASSVPHSRMVIGIDLGLLPDSLSFGQLLTDLTELATNTIGQQAEATITKVPVQGFVSKTNADILAQARETNRTNLLNNLAARTNAEDQVVELQAQVAALENYIANLP